LTLGGLLCLLGVSSHKKGAAQTGSPTKTFARPSSERSAPNMSSTLGASPLSKENANNLLEAIEDLRSVCPSSYPPVILSHTVSCAHTWQYLQNGCTRWGRTCRVDAFLDLTENKCAQKFISPIKYLCCAPCLLWSFLSFLSGSGGAEEGFVAVQHRFWWMVCPGKSYNVHMICRGFVLQVDRPLYIICDREMPLYTVW
jgi:hypothetical protein